MENKKHDTNLQTLTLKNAMGIKVDELDIEIANYVEESLEKIKKHKVYGKWIKTNKKLKRGESEEWYEINELVDDVWWGAIKKFDCEKEMVAPQDKDGTIKEFELKESVRFKPLEYLCEGLDVDMVREIKERKVK